METISLLKEAFQILAVSAIEMWTVWLELRNRFQVILETQVIVGHIPKEEFETSIKKMGQKNGSMFGCKLMVVWERKCQIYSLGKWGCCGWINLCFRSLFSFPFSGGVHGTVFTKPAVTWDLFYIQTSVGACWKGNALQNSSTLSEFR